MSSGMRSSSSPSASAAERRAISGAGGRSVVSVGTRTHARVGRGDGLAGPQWRAEVQPLRGAKQLDGDHVARGGHHLLQLDGGGAPMLTKSSWPAEVGIEAMLAGWASTPISLTSAAATYCAIM